jgi:hypothetical protein
MKKVIIKGFTFTLALAIMLSGLGVFSISSTASAESQPEPSLTAPEPVVGEWCSALYGIFMTAYNSPANYNAVADLNNDGVVNISDFGMLAAMYSNGDDATCYAQFQGTYDFGNYLNVDWCNGLIKGIEDSFHSQSGDANYSAIFDLDDDGQVNIVDEAIAASINGNQAICYPHYTPPLAVMEEPDAPAEPEAFVHGEWCSALYGLFQTAYNNPANYNAVADLNNDGVVSVSDFGMLAAIYGNGDNAGCYAQFEDPTANFHFDEENHLDIDWCNGLWQGIQDSFHSQSGDANYSSIFDLNGDGTIGLIDQGIVAYLLGENDQSACYPYYVPPMPEWGGNGGGGGGGGSSDLSIVIDNVLVIPEITSATVTWNTNRSATTILDYGTENYDFNTNDGLYTVEHQVVLNDLEPGTLYHFLVSAMNPADQLFEDIDRTFTTLGEIVIEEEVVEEPVIEEPKIEPEVLGEKIDACIPDIDIDIIDTITFAEKSLLRGCGPEVYLLKNDMLVHIPSWQELHDKYFAHRIYNVSNEVLALYPHWTPPQVAGIKVYGDGSLIRGTDKMVYIIENGAKRHITNLEELVTYIGKKIYDVSDDVLALY